VIILTAACSKQESNLYTQHIAVENDSLLIWKDRVTDKAYSSVQRKSFANKYLNKIEEFNNDSVRNSYYYKVPFIFYKLGDTTSFRLHIKKALRIAKKQKDSAAIADLYWDYANFYYHKKNLNDSAFYFSSKAQKVFESIGDYNKSGRMLFIMATSQKK
jgi:tetratricopeptide (TPR) repeat protein